jgi:hypothetical protein
MPSSMPAEQRDRHGPGDARAPGRARPRRPARPRPRPSSSPWASPWPSSSPWASPGTRPRAPAEQRPASRAPGRSALTKLTKPPEQHERRCGSQVPDHARPRERPGIPPSSATAAVITGGQKVNRIPDCRPCSPNPTFARTWPTEHPMPRTKPGRYDQSPSTHCLFRSPPAAAENSPTQPTARKRWHRSPESRACSETCVPHTIRTPFREAASFYRGIEERFQLLAKC